jgi:hypothetical protein
MNKYAQIYIEEFQKSASIGSTIAKQVSDLAYKTQLGNIGRTLADVGTGYVDTLKMLIKGVFSEGGKNTRLIDRLALLDPRMGKHYRVIRKWFKEHTPKGQYDPLNSAMLGSELAAYTPAALAGTGALGAGAYGLNAIMNQKPPSPPPSLLEKVFGGK